MDKSLDPEIARDALVAQKKRSFRCRTRKSSCREEPLGQARGELKWQYKKEAAEKRCPISGIDSQSRAARICFMLLSSLILSAYE
jgi:hypothetical protein